MTLNTANAYLMMSCNDKRSQTEQRENRGHQGPAFSRLHHLRASEEAGGADHRQHQRQSTRDREEIQPATTPSQLQRNHALTIDQARHIAKTTQSKTLRRDMFKFIKRKEREQWLQTKLQRTASASPRR